MSMRETRLVDGEEFDFIHAPVYDDGRTKQSFKDECCINRILQRAQVAGGLSHLERHEAEYGDFTEWDDLLSAHAHLQRGQEIFSELPSSIRAEFGQDAGRFFAFVNDPANAPHLAEFLPELAEPGRQFPDVDNSRPVTPDPPADPRAARPQEEAEPAGEPKGE